jgi:hypothetical protein
MHGGKTPRGEASPHHVHGIYSPYSIHGLLLREQIRRERRFERIAAALHALPEAEQRRVCLSPAAGSAFFRRLFPKRRRGRLSLAP